MSSKHPRIPHSQCTSRKMRLHSEPPVRSRNDASSCHPLVEIIQSLCQRCLQQMRRQRARCLITGCGRKDRDSHCGKALTCACSATFRVATEKVEGAVINSDGPCNSRMERNSSPVRQDESSSRYSSDRYAGACRCDSLQFRLQLQHFQLG